MNRLMCFLCVLLLSAPAAASDSLFSEDGRCGPERDGILNSLSGSDTSCEVPDAAFFDEGDAANNDEQLDPVLHTLDLASYSLNPLATKAVARSLDLFSYRMKDVFSVWLSRSYIYLPVVQEILKAEGLPEEMSYLPLIESGFNPKAFSRARAAGPWQFIAGTARKYGLKIDHWVDERRDPVKSTRAAARYLKDLYEIFGSWSLSMAAYNAGEGKILRALRKTKQWDYWTLHKTRHIKRETKNYVPNFIAARLIAANPADYGFDEIPPQQDFVYDEVELEKPLNVSVIAKCAGTTAGRIKELNPELRRGCTPPNVKGYVLRIPKGTKEAFLEKFASLSPEDLKLRPSVPKIYRVRRGDTLSGISKKTGVPMSKIMRLNRISRRSIIRIGQRLRLW